MSFKPWANCTPLVFHNNIEVVLEENTDATTKLGQAWNRYLVYLVQWTVDHDSPFHYGMSPAGFDEWEDNEDAENEGDKCECEGE